MTSFILGLFEVSLTMAAAVLILLLLSKFFGGRFTAKCRYIVWALVIIRLCVPVGSGLVTPLFTVDLPQNVSISSPAEKAPTSVTAQSENFVTENTPASPAVTEQDTMPQYNEPSKELSGVVDVPSAVVPQNSIEVNKEPEAQVGSLNADTENDTLRTVDTDALLKIAFWVWAAGYAVFLGIRVGAYLIFAGKLKRTGVIREADTRAVEVYSELCRSLGIKKAPKLYVSLVPMSPMLCGFFRKRIIIPDFEFADKHLVSALSHELVHCKRGDVWMKLLCTAALAVNWFNPLAYAAVSRCTSEMELSCDEAVLRGMSESDRIAYGRTLLDIVRRSGSVRPSGLTTGMNPKRSAVKERLMNVLDMTKKRRGVAVIATVVAFCIVAGAVVGCSFGVSEPDNATYYVPEYMKYAEGNDMYELFLTYENGGIIATRSLNGVSDALYTVTFEEEKLSLIEVASPEGELLIKRIFEYNENGDAANIYFTDAEENGEYLKCVFTYDDNGLLLKKEFTSDSEPAGKTEEHQYNEEGKLVSKHEYSPNGTLNEVREYDEAGREIKWTAFDKYIPTLKAYETIEYEFDDGGRIIKQTNTFNWGGRMDTVDVTEKKITYYENGNVATVVNLIEETGEPDYSNKVEYKYTEDGRHIIELTDRHDAYAGKFDPETLESDKLYLEGAYIKWRECDKAEYERYLQIYLNNNLFDDDRDAEKNYLIRLDDHAWFLDYTNIDTSEPYKHFVSKNGGTAEDRAEWYKKFATTEYGSMENQVKMVEAFLTNDVDTLEELARASDGAYESYRGMKIGDYKIGIEMGGSYDKMLFLDVEILESNNEVLTPGHHRLLAIDYINSYLCTTETYAELCNYNKAEDPLHKYVSALVTYGLTDFDGFKEGINEEYRNLATYLAVNRMSVTDSEKYSDLRSLRKEEVEYLGWCSFTADEIAEYVDIYFDTKDFVPEKFEFYNDYYSYEFKDGYYVNNGHGDARANITFEEDREENGCTVVTANVWADQSATVRSKTVEYHFETVEGEPKIVKTKTLYDSGFKPSVGNGQ